LAGPLLLHRERYPESIRGAFESANLDLGVEHVGVMLGPVGWELVTGVVPLALLQHVLPMNHFYANTDACKRDNRLRELVDNGILALDHIAPAELVRYPASAFFRHRPAPHAGFHFSMRATRGSSQPLINGFRTVV
jgi:hypothetical protein